MSLSEILSKIKATAEALESVPSSQAGCVRMRQSLLLIKKDCDGLRKGLMVHSKELKESRRPDLSLVPAVSHAVKSPDPEPEVKSLDSDESDETNDPTELSDEAMPLNPPVLKRAKAKRPVKVKPLSLLN